MVFDVKMSDEDLFYRAPPAEARISNTAVIERARIGNGGGNLIYPVVPDFGYEESDSQDLSDLSGLSDPADLSSLDGLIDESGQGEDDLEMWRR